MRGVSYTEMLFVPLTGVNATWDMITCKYNKLLQKKKKWKHGLRRKRKPS